MRKDEIPASNPSHEKFLAKWEAILTRGQERLHDALDAGEKGDVANVQRLSVACGIASEKVLLFSGSPTAIIGGLPEHQSRLPEILARFESIEGTRVFPGLPALERPAVDVPVTPRRSTPPRAAKTAPPESGA